ncbi:proteoglycan 4-like [Procambarus clarkii]|uniref:proteoglycan 4-like n=1 Tax=Procambarus clarkii TaxID=6728 RepID=UPI003744718C
MDFERFSNDIHQELCAAGEAEFTLNDVEEWLDIDALDPPIGHLTDDEIIQNVTGTVDDDGEENEDENYSNLQSATCADALFYVEILLDIVSQTGNPELPGPTKVTTKGPTKVTTKGPTKVTTKGPTKVTTKGPTKVTTKGPTKVTTKGPTKVTTKGPTKVTTKGPTKVTTKEPKKIKAGHTEDAGDHGWTKVETKRHKNDDDVDKTPKTGSNPANEGLIEEHKQRLIKLEEVKAKKEAAAKARMEEEAKNITRTVEVEEHNRKIVLGPNGNTIHNITEKHKVRIHIPAKGPTKVTTKGPTKVTTKGPTKVTTKGPTKVTTKEPKKIQAAHTEDAGDHGWTKVETKRHKNDDDVDKTPKTGSNPANEGLIEEHKQRLIKLEEVKAKKEAAAKARMEEEAKNITRTVEVEEHNRKIVLGPNGNTIHNITEKHKVRIHIPAKGTEGPITVRGLEGNVTTATALIEKLIADHEKARKAKMNKIKKGIKTAPR